MQERPSPPACSYQRDAWISPSMIGLLAVSLIALSNVACRSNPPINVGVVFENSWKLGRQTLTDRDKSRIKETALETLREAYAAFGVRFNEGPFGERLIKVADTAYSSSLYLGAVGVTYLNSTVSRVHFDALYYTELTAAGCKDIVGCERKTREEMIVGLGRGVGATGAHELGHQAGFRFALHSRCDDCYDSVTSTSYEHFFGRKHWSEDALAAMRRVLPPGKP